jgi:hypothetical protein
LAPQLLLRAPGPPLDFSLVLPRPNPPQPPLRPSSSALAHLLPLLLQPLQPLQALLSLLAQRTHHQRAPAQLLRERLPRFSLGSQVPQRQHHSLRLVLEHRRAGAWTQVWTLALALRELSELKRLEASARPHLASELKHLAVLLRLSGRRQQALAGLLGRAALAQEPPRPKGSGQLQQLQPADSEVPRAVDSEQPRRQHLAPNQLHRLIPSASNLLQLRPAGLGQQHLLSERGCQPPRSDRLRRQQVDLGRQRLRSEAPRRLSMQVQEQLRLSMQVQEQLRLSMQEQEQLRQPVGSIWAERQRSLGARGRESSGGRHGSEGSDTMVGVLGAVSTSQNLAHPVPALLPNSSTCPGLLYHCPCCSPARV